VIYRLLIFCISFSIVGQLLTSFTFPKKNVIEWSDSEVSLDDNNELEESDDELWNHSFVSMVRDIKSCASVKRTQLFIYVPVRLCSQYFFHLDNPPEAH
jgi:hypothetical protein